MPRTALIRFANQLRGPFIRFEGHHAQGDGLVSSHEAFTSQGFRLGHSKTWQTDDCSLAFRRHVLQRGPDLSADRLARFAPRAFLIQWKAVSRRLAQLLPRYRHLRDGVA